MMKKTLKRFLILLIVLASTLLLAACSKVEFKLDFIVDGQTYSSINTSGEETIKIPEDPVKEGYTFDGWYWDKDVWQKPFTANSLLDAPLSSNMAVHAKWVSAQSLFGTEATFAGFESTGENTYSMVVSNATSTFVVGNKVSISSHSKWSLSTDIFGNNTIASKVVNLAVGDNTYYALVTADDGSSELYILNIRRKPVYNVIFDVDGGTSVDVQKIEEGSHATAPTTSKTGYTFSGWNYDFTQPINENKIIVASWAANEYTITFNPAGGTCSSSEMTVAFDSEYELPIPSREGYAFGGWNYGRTQITDSVWNIDRDVVLKARWTPIEYNIVYNLNEGVLGTSNPTSYTVESGNIVLNSPTKEGCVFLGWTGNGVTTPSKNLVIPAGSTGNREYTANWEFIGYEIKYNLNGGQNNPNNPSSFIINDPDIVLKAPTREGYLFDGWYTTSTFIDGSRYTTIPMGWTEDVEVYAKWTPITYTIQFYKNASFVTGTMYDQVFEYDMLDILAFNSFSKVGYTFVGWTTNADGTGLFYGDGTEIFNLTETQGVVITLYAQWEANTYTVTLDKNGSEGGTDTVISVYDAEMPTAIAPNILTGYRFDGYYDAQGVQYYDSNMLSVKAWDKTEDTTLYARWIPYVVTIILDQQNGTGGTVEVEATFDLAMPMAFAPTRTGYIFAGYFTEPMGQGTQYYNENMESVRNCDLAESVTLYASWVARSYSVSFDSNGGSTQQEGVSATYDAQMPEITIAPIREGYIFLGYFDASSGGTKYYNADLTSAKIWDKTSNTTLYAQWQAITYTVTFNVNGGTGSMESQTFTYDVANTLSANAFERTGYTFAGWTINSDGTGTLYTDAQSVTNLSGSDGAEVVLYAKWTAKTVTGTLADLSTPYASYTVSFDLNGASGTAPETQTVTETVGLVYPAIPTRSDYVFAGWYTTADCSGTPYDFTANVTANTTLYAKWLNYSGYGTLFVGGNSGSITFPSRSSSYRYYAFVPLVSGSITIYSSSSSDTYGYLFDSSKTQLTYNDDGGSNRNFSITYNVTAGQLYYIVACAYSSSSSCTGTIYISGTATPTAGGVATGISLVTEQLTYDQNFTLQVPTQTGYTFMGWYDGEGGTGTQYTDATGASIRTWDKEVNTMLYAKWEAVQNTVTFDKQGGTDGSDSVTATYDSAMPTATAPTKVGYTFMGYYTAISGGIKYYNADMTSAAEWNLAEDTTLYAQWSANTYTITLNDQNGSETTNATVVYDSTLPTVSMPAKVGYTFLGYYDAEVGGTQYYDATMGSTMTWTRVEGITLYAHWEANTYSVEFNMNEGSGEQSSVTATYGSAMPAITVAPTREGYIFLGYFDAVTGGTKYYNADLTSANTWANAANTTLYAQWQRIPYYVSFNANNGTGTMENQAFEYGVSANLNSNAFTRVGYTFTGWNTAADGSGTAYANVASVLNLTNVNEGVVTLYAQWTAKTVTGTLADLSTPYASYTVSFDLNGASGTAPAAQVVTDTVGLTYPTIPTRSGYIFAGWYTTSSCTGTPYDFSANVTADTTLYAKWISTTRNVLLPGSNNTIYLYSSSTYYTFVPLKSGSVTITLGKTGYIRCSTTGTSGYSSLTINCTAGTAYVFYVESYYQYTSSSYVGNTYLNISSSIPTAGGVATGISLVTEQLTYGQNFTLQVPTQTGYTFMGWYDGEGGTGTQYTDATGASVRTWDKEVNTTLYAKWEASQNTVTFDKQEGTDGSDSVTAIYGSAMPTATAPVKVGYTFMGYYTAVSGGTKYYNADMTSAKDWDLMENTTLYARWSANTYTITLNNQDGNGALSATATYGSTLPTVSMPTKIGHTFLGYYDAEVGGTQYYDATMSSTMTWTRVEDITLYAHWEANTYTVNFNTNQGSGAQSAVTATYGSAMPAITVAPTREGYIFLGYYDAVTGGTKYYNADLTSANDWANTANTTLYARWQGVPYSVSFNANNGTGTMENQAFEYGVSANLNSNAFTRVGYTFTGWNTAADGSGTAYANVASVLNLTNVNEGVVTLYAQWTAKTVTGTLADLSTNPSYTVSFNLNGASGTAPAAQVVTDTVGLTYPTIPTRSGYIFAGWYTTSSCSGSPYNFAANVTADITLYAKWIYPSSYTKILSIGGNTGSTSFNSSIKYYPFVSLVDQTITIYTSHTSGDPKIYLYNANKSQLTYDDDGYGNRDSRITYTVTAGTLYYVGFGCYSSSSGTGYMYLSGTTYPTAGGKASGVVLTTEQLTYDQNFTLQVPTQTGYTFAGWYDGEGGTGTQYTDATGASIRTWDKEVNTTLYAKWEANGNTVTFDKQGGTDGSDSVTATYDSAMPTATAPVKVGYTFMGYYTAVSGGTKYYNADMTSARDWNLTTNTTLYARWSANTYTITFDTQGGNGTSSATVSYGSTLPVVSVPTKIGATFLGYYDAEVGGTQYYDATMSSTMTWSITEGITLYAHWEAIVYTVNFNTNQGSGAQSAITVTYGSAMPAITVAPTREGYIFLGYFDAITGGTKYYNADLTGANTWANTANTTLYAHWQGVPYSVSFNANSGTGTMENQAFVYGVSANLTSNAFTRVGYTFAGWNTAADGSGTTYANAASVLNLTSVNEGIVTLYAQWTANTYTVTYNKNASSATGTMALQTLTYDSAANLTSCGFERVGYTFAGWSTNSDGTGTVYENAAEVLNLAETLNANVNLYAIWTNNTYTVTFDKQEGTEGSDSVTATYDSAMPTATAPTKVGYTFMGYYTAISGGTKYYNADMTSAKDWDLTTNTTLYARWSANTYTIVFDKQGGNGTSSATAVYNATLPIVSKPTKVGQAFLGYYDAEVGGTQYYDENMSSTIIWTRTEGITLYAHWEAIVYTVDFNANQGVGDQTSVTVIYGSEMPAITVAPTREGYIFLGYFDAVTGGTKYYNADLTSASTWANTADTTLYAHWQGVPYYVSFNANNGTGTMEDQEFEYGVSESLNSNELTRVGYTFAGWNTAADGSGTAYANGASINSLTTVNGETVTLYAQWTAKTVTGTLADLSTNPSYTVSFNLNGASGTAPAAQVVTDTVAIQYPTNPTRSGYLFTGWYTTAACTTLYNFTSNISSDMTLYAGWSNCTIYSNYWSTYSGVLQSTNKSHSSSSTYRITAPAAVRVSFRYKVSSESNYDRLNISKNGSTLVTVSGSTSYVSYSVNLNAGDYLTFSYSKDGSVSSGSDCAYIADLTYTSIVSYVGTATASGIVLTTEQLTYDQNFTLQVPTQAGYNFAGWYDGEGGTGTQYTDATGASIRTWDKEVNTTLYAKWDAVQYNITYDLDGGTNNINNPTGYNIESENVTFYAPTKAGYTFIGWTSGSVVVPNKNFVISTGSMGDITLTANWIEYDLNAITYNTSTKDFSMFETPTAEYFGAQCIDTDGNAVAITASFVTPPVAGETTSILLVATNGGKTTQTVIENVKIYGTPTINVGNTTINSTDAITASTFEATATDSFGNALSVSVSLTEGDVTCGGYRTYAFVATDRVGNEANISVSVSVYCATDIEIAVNDVAGINVGSAGVEFGAIARDSFGEECTVEFEVISGDVNTAGSTVNVRFTATDVMGNTSTLTVNTVKVYGTPVATMNVAVITDSTVANTIYTVRDSFGVILNATITFASVPVSGQNVAVQIVAQDAIGNQLNTEYILPVICTFHSIGANCTCEVCGTTVHVEGANCTCLVCSSSFHNLNANCVCSVCGITSHNVNANCVCVNCGNEYHTDNGAGTCLVCGVVLNMADVWDGTIATSFARGSGTSSNPYIIETGAQLAYLASRVNAGTSYSGCYFRLDNDIDLNNINWTPIGIGSTSSGSDYTYRAFSGYFDGNGHTIANLKVSTTSLKRAGLFGALNGATITKLGIVGADVYISQSNIISGGILAGTMNNSTVTQCYVEGEVEVIDTSVGNNHCACAGAIVGTTYGSCRIENCYAQADVSGRMPNDWNAYVGGIVGRVAANQTIISKTYFQGQVYAYGYDDGYAGGFIGIDEGGSSISNCFVIADITSSDYKDAIASAWNGHRPTTTKAYYSSATSSAIGTSTSLSNFKSQSWLTGTLGWNFDTVWTFVDGNDYPVLKAFN